MKQKMINNTSRYSFLLGGLFVILSLVLSLVAPGIANVQAAEGAIWTTDTNCVTQNVNSYGPGDHVWLAGAGMPVGSDFSWSIVGQPGHASSRPGETVAGGAFTIDDTGGFCFHAYTVDPRDAGEFKVFSTVGGDNYSVPGDIVVPTNTPPPPANTNTPINTTEPTGTPQPPAESTSTPISTGTQTPPVGEEGTPTPPIGDEGTPTATEPVGGGDGTPTTTPEPTVLGTEAQPTQIVTVDPGTSVPPTTVPPTTVPPTNDPGSTPDPVVTTAPSETGGTLATVPAPALNPATRSTVLIPVTGDDDSMPKRAAGFLFNVGLALLGLGLVMRGLGKR